MVWRLSKALQIGVDMQADTLVADGPSLPSIREQLGLGLSAIEAADRGLQKAESALVELREDLRDRRSFSYIRRHSHDHTTYAERLQGAAASAGESGVNLLVIGDGEEAVAAIGAALTRGPEGAIALRSVDVDRARTALFDHDRPEGVRRGILDRTLACSSVTFGSSHLDRRLNDTGLYANAFESVEAALAGVKTAFSLLSIARSRVGLQASFLASLSRDWSDPLLPTTAGALDETTLREKALETRQLLSAQTQSITNLNHQTVLKLFQPT